MGTGIGEWEQELQNGNRNCRMGTGIEECAAAVD